MKTISTRMKREQQMHLVFPSFSRLLHLKKTWHPVRHCIRHVHCMGP